MSGGRQRMLEVCRRALLRDPEVKRLYLGGKGEDSEAKQD